MRQVKLFDTTLRDGEQTPRVNFTTEDKVKIALQLEKLGVDVIEGGFAIASPKSYEALVEMSKVLKTSTLCSLARSIKKDIDTAYEAIKAAPKHRIHVFIATSPIHMEFKLKMNKEQVLAKAIESVAYAKTLCDDVEFSAEDATRSDRDFLVEIFSAVIKAGATVLNVPDTVGYVTPNEYADLMKYLIAHVEGIENVEISVHCHNDLGMAVANSLAAVHAGATQIEGSINGIGERAGNVALEEVVMALKTRKDYYSDLYTNITTEQIYNTSQLVQYLSGINVQPNKAIVGANAFSHESGIHQHGVLANRETYEIMSPQSIGLPENEIVLGALSGRHAFVDRINKLGISYDNTRIDQMFEQFKRLADTKKEIHDKDLVVIVNGSIDSSTETKVISYSARRENDESLAEISLNIDGDIISEKGKGVGSVDALYNAISKVYKGQYPLHSYQLSTVTDDVESLAKVDITIEFEKKQYYGRAVSSDIVEASIDAYLLAIGSTQS